jgi:metal-responsive CopG/Arc/MetJ family transcriptional regulator
MMRTTVTLEDDVAKALERIAKDEGIPPKEIINTAVREFVGRRRRKPAGAAYRTPTVDLGTCLIGSLDDVHEALALAEGDDAR